MLLGRGLTYLGSATERRGDETAAFITDHIRPLMLWMAHHYLRRPSSATPDYFLAPRAT
jgi:hypothetical protein